MYNQNENHDAFYNNDYGNLNLNLGENIHDIDLGVEHNHINHQHHSQSKIKMNEGDEMMNKIDIDLLNQNLNFKESNMSQENTGLKPV